MKRLTLPHAFAGGALLFVHPAASFACHHGHGGGGHSGGGHSNGSYHHHHRSSYGGSGHSGGWSSAGWGSRAPSGCQEVSEIVGRQECARFGRWDVGRGPSFSFEAGFLAQGIDLSGFTGSGSVEHFDTNHPFTVSPGRLASHALAMGAAFRVNVFFTSHFYAGVEGSIAGGGVGGPATVFGPLSETPDWTLQMSGGVVAGAATHAGPVTFRAEVLAGLNLTTVGFVSRYLSCDDSSSLTVASWRVEPRVAVEMRLGPQVSVGVMGGANVLDVNEWSGLGYVRLSTRTFDGAATH